MNFSALPQTTQDLIMVNFEFFGKLFILVVALIAALYYLNVVHNKKETPYIFLSFIKMLAYLSSMAYLWLSPLFILVLYPIVELGTFIALFLWGYALIFVLGWIFFTVNLWYYTPFFMLKLGGYNVAIGQDNIVLASIDKALGLNKLKRGKIRIGL